MLLGVMWMMTALVTGFMVGRISMYGMWESEEEQENRDPEGDGRLRIWRRRGHYPEADRVIWSVGSPVSGEIVAQEEGEHPTVIIYPDTDRLYAPVSGKISRLFPMGNSFCFTTEFGTELYIQAGAVDDDMLARYYRPRIIRNEVVEKGKLLLEFDRKGLEAEGASVEVSVCVDSTFYGGEVRIAAGEHVKVGEELLQIQEPSGQAAVSTV
ncbi:MAG: PTS glucose transporter subunit IIA [Lachnospiraceae bacterium]|nr:PTS glucose transporter subunit IIA [Lachnospiraceae bacterium]